MADKRNLCRERRFHREMVPAEKIWQDKLRARGGVQGGQVCNVAEQTEIRNRIVPVCTAGHHDQQRECSEKQSEGAASVHRHLPALEQQNSVYLSFLLMV
jgi:hypothetical protein